MTGRNDGGPAFPLQNAQFTDAYGGAPGMSLRDYFAGHALAGMAAGTLMDAGTLLIGNEDAAAVYAYKLADAMLEERAK